MAEGALDGDATGASLLLADVRALLGYLLKASREKKTWCAAEPAPIRPPSPRRSALSGAERARKTLTLIGRERKFSPSLFV